MQQAQLNKRWVMMNDKTSVSKLNDGIKENCDQTIYIYIYEMIGLSKNYNDVIHT